MFLLFTFLMLINSVADNEKVILAYRYEVAGLPINILDFLLGLMFVVALATMSRWKEDTDRVHPMLYWSVVVLTLSVVAGLLGALRNNIELRFWVTIARNVLTLPLCVFLGYHTLRSTRMAGWATYVMILGSLGSAIFVLLFVRETGEMLSTFDKLRRTTFGGDAGVYAMTFLSFTMVAGVRFLPLWASLILIPFSAICFFSLPHRSNWVAGAATLLFAVLILPRVRVARRAGYAALLGVVMAVTMSLAVSAYSQMTGRDFGEYVTKRLRSLSPFEDEQASAKDKKAWASRIPGALRELEMWRDSPFMGQGFGIQMKEEEMGQTIGGFRHNVWTSSLAESGIFGLLGYTLLPVSAMWIGFRLVREAHDKGTLYMGALGAVAGCWAFMMSFMTLSINTQRMAIPLGLACGMVYKCRAMQLTMRREYAGYYDDDPADLPLGHAAGGEPEY